MDLATKIKKILNPDILVPLCLIAFFVIAFFHFNYQTGLRKDDGYIFPISSFSMFNRSMDPQHLEKIKEFE